MQKQNVDRKSFSPSQSFNEVSADLPSIYYQSCTSGEQCLVSYSHTRNILVFTKLVAQLQIFNKENGGWDGKGMPSKDFHGTIPNMGGERVLPDSENLFYTHNGH